MTQESKTPQVLMGAIIEYSAMPYALDESDKKVCTSCKSESYRVVEESVGSRTWFSMKARELFDMKQGLFRDINRADLWPVKAYLCSNKKCGHLDFYTISFPKPETTA